MKQRYEKGELVIDRIFRVRSHSLWRVVRIRGWEEGEVIRVHSVVDDLVDLVIWIVEWLFVVEGCEDLVVERREWSFSSHWWSFGG